MSEKPEYDYVYRPCQGGIVNFDESSRATMIACEPVLARDWNTPEEDAAWAHLQDIAKCPHCRAPTLVSPIQTVARCGHCGARFAVRKAGE